MATNSKNPFCTNTKRLRLAKGMTQAELALLAEMSTNTLNHIENSLFHEDMDRVTLRKLRAISRVLGCSVAELYPALERCER